MKKFYIGVCCVLTIILIQSCQKIDTTTLGVGLIPAVDNINTFDTLLDIVADTNQLYQDTSIVSRYDDHALGYMEDPEFGNTSAAVYVGLTPLISGSTPFTNKDSALRVDSVVLSLSYAGLYGDSTSIENFRVSEIDPKTSFKDTSRGYRINSPYFPVLSNPLGTATVNFTTLNDPKQFKQGKDTALTTQQNVLRIKLDNALGVRLAGYDTSNAYKNDSAFASLFKGIAITVDSGSSSRKKALAYFNLSDTARTKLTVYYRVTVNNATDTLYTNFIFNAAISSRNANLVRRSIAGSNYARNMQLPGNKEKLYIQTSPGSYATFSIPALGTLSNRLVYKAELIMGVVPSLENNNFTAPILFLDLIDAANNQYITVQNDFLVDNSGNYNYINFGGILKSDTAYVFTLTRYVQGVVSRRQNSYKLRVYAPFQTQPRYSAPNIYPVTSDLLNFAFLINSQIARGRVVLGGGSHPTQKMKLRIIYSRI